MAEKQKTEVPIREELERMLAEVRDKGLVHWQPNTAHGMHEKDEMLRRITLLLARPR